MSKGSITGARVTVHAFAADVLSADGRCEVEQGANLDWRSIRLEDGFGTSIVVSGDRSSLRLLVSRLLDGLQPDPQAPEGGGAA